MDISDYAYDSIMYLRHMLPNYEIDIEEFNGAAKVICIPNDPEELSMSGHVSNILDKEQWWEMTQHILSFEDTEKEEGLYNVF